MEKKNKFQQLDPDSLAKLYQKSRPTRRAVIDELLETLEEMHRDVLEQVVEIKEKEGFKEANELINYIKSK